MNVLADFDHEQRAPVNLDLDEKEFSTPKGPMRDSGINSTLGSSPSKSTKHDTDSPDKTESPEAKTPQSKTPEAKTPQPESADNAGEITDTQTGVVSCCLASRL